MNSHHAKNYLIFRRQTELERIAFELEAGRDLNDKDRDFISAALLSIARGEDARKVFGLKAGRGQRTSFSERNKIAGLQLVLGWISTAIEPVELDEHGEHIGGLGLTLEIACARAAELFPGRTEQTLRNEWATRATMRGTQDQNFELFLSPRVRPI